jgi:hypothetical protein
MLISLEEIKAYLGIDPLDLTHDAYLTAQILAATAMVETYCGREFELLATAQLIYRPNKTLNLTRFPIVTVEKIVGEYNDVDLMNYKIDHLNGRLLSKYGHYCGYYGDGYLSVEYTGGYAPEDLPADLKSVLMDLVASRYYNQYADVSRPVKSEKVDGIGSTTYAVDGNGKTTGFGNWAIEQFSGILDLYKIETVIAE